MVVLPAPVWPTMAAVSPGSTVKETPRRIHSMSWSRVSSCSQRGVVRLCGERLELLVGEGLVGEPDVAELDAAGAVAGDGVRGRDDLGLGVEQLEDALAGGHGGLQDVVLLAEVLNGAEEALRVLHEGDEDAEGDGAVQDAEAAAPDDQRDGDGAEEFDRRVVPGVGEDGVGPGGHVLGG